MKNRLNTKYEINEQERKWLDKKMNWKYINKAEEKEEIDIFIRQIINKLHSWKSQLYIKFIM